MPDRNIDMPGFACRVCGSRALRLYYTQGNLKQYRFYKCSACGLVNYDLNGGLNQEKYSGNTDDPRDGSLRNNRNKTQTYRFIGKHIRDRGALLDIGCNNGRLLYLAMQDGWEVMGLELHQSMARMASGNLGIRVLAENFMAFDNPEVLSFDMVVMTHVLEHIPDSLLAMRSINSLLKAGGHALFEFPDIEGVSMKFKRLLDRIGIHRRRYPGSYMPGHCNEFCRESFEYLLEKTGFELLVWENYSRRSWLTPLYSLTNLGNKARALVRKKAGRSGLL